MSYPQRPTDPRYYSPSLSISIDIDESPRAPSIGVVDLPPEEEPHSPLVDPRSPSRKSKAPRMELRFIKNIQTGSTCSTVYVRDIPSGKAICLKVVRLEHGNEEMGQKLKSSRDRELEAYKAIAKSDPECRFIMNCHGVFEDDTFMYFAMVSERIIPVVSLVTRLMVFHPLGLYQERLTRIHLHGQRGS